MSTDKAIPETASVPDEIVILAARQLLDSLPATDITSATRSGYEAEFWRLINRNRSPDNLAYEAPDRVWAAIVDTSSKRTYHRRMASIRFVLPGALRKALDAEKISLLKFLVGLHQLMQTNKGVCAIANPRPRHSKRTDLRGLPEDWRENMLQAISPARWRLPFLLSAVAGCRPEELAKGIKVIATSDTLAITIVGAKVKNGQGQPTRTITYELNDGTSKLVRALTDAICEETPESNGLWEATIQIQGKAGFTSCVRRAGRRLWPKRPADITPYSLRHAAASDFKAHLPHSDVSAALGHMVDGTSRFYGQRQMSSAGGLKPMSVDASREVRATAKVGKFSKSKLKT